MKNISKLFLLIIIAIALTACAGKTCISLGGSYEGATGNLEVCHDAAASKNANLPVFRDSQGNESILLNEQQAKLLLGKVMPASRDVQTPGEEKPGIYKIVEILRQKE